MAEKNLIVAVYDFRGKQEYIYRTNRVKEIMGASEIIRTAFSDAIGAFDGRVDDDKDKAFSVDGFVSGGFDGAVLYEGGGNLVMLFRDDEKYLAFNKSFSWWLINNAPGLAPVCGAFGFSDLKNTGFKEVTEKIFGNQNEYKRLAAPFAEANVLPFTQIDRKSTQPVVKKVSVPEEKSLTEESVKKLEKFDTIVLGGEQELDKLVHRRGVESLLAVIHIDGNSMGKRVKEYIKEGASFEEGVNLQREFTKKIDDAFVNNPLEAIRKIAGTISVSEDKDTKTVKMREIVGAGDEITIVCNARKALEITLEYFKSLDASNKEQGQNYSACAGVAICHSHAPFSDVYEIAKQCCDSGKDRIRELGEAAQNHCYFDAYFCGGAITGTLEELRARQETGRTRMPYCVYGEDERHDFESGFARVGKELSRLSRTPVKGLRDIAFRSRTELELELTRIKSGFTEDRELDLTAEDREILYDVTTFFDLWYSEEKENA